MTRQFSNRQPSLSSEREDGVIMVLFALLLVAFIAMIGMGVDSGNLYRLQTWAQRAADAGAIAGATKYATDFRYVAGGGAGPVAEAQDAAKEVVVRNMALHGITIDPDQVTATLQMPPVQSNRTMLVQFTVRQAPLFLQVIRGPSAQEMTVSATVEIQPAVVNLLLDYSGSMYCDEATNCNPTDCRYSTGKFSMTSCGDTKMRYLQDAVRDFVMRFDPQYDRLSVVAFTTGAQVIHPLDAVKTSINGQMLYYDPVLLQQQINQIPALTTDLANPVPSATNPSDAFWMAYQDVLRAMNDDITGEIGRLSKNAVFFSDGAPNVARFRFVNSTHADLPTTNSAIPVIDANRDTSGTYMWAVDWPGLNAGDPPVRGLMSLINRNAFDDSSTPEVDPIPLKWSQATCPGYTGETVQPPGVPGCSKWTMQDVGAVKGLRNDPASAVRSCFPTTGAPGTIPISYARLNGSANRTKEIDGACGTTECVVAKLRELFYDVTVTYADDYRGLPSAGKDNYIYAIGLGTAAGAGADAYQGIFDNSTRKSIFLRRIAKDRLMDRNATFANDPPTVATPYEEYEYFMNGGFALEARDGAQLEQLFDVVARRIKLMLVS